MGTYFLSDPFVDLFGDFYRPFKEVERYHAYAVEDGMMIVVNTLGVSADDLKIEWFEAKKCIAINGATENEELGLRNSVNYNLQVKVESGQVVDSIAYDVRDGYTYIRLNYKREETPKIAIRRDSSVVKPQSKKKSK